MLGPSACKRLFNFGDHKRGFKKTVLGVQIENAGCRLMWKDKNSGFRIRWCHSWYMLCILCKGCYRVCITCASSYSINKWKIGLPRSVLSSTIEMFKMFKTQVEPRAAGEWFHFKVTWKIAVDLFFTISLANDNCDIHQRLDNACKKEKNKLRRHHIIRELKQRCFWATHVNRKWGLFHFKAPWRSQICISKCLNYYRDELS